MLCRARHVSVDRDGFRWRLLGAVVLAAGKAWRVAVQSVLCRLLSVLWRGCKLKSCQAQGDLQMLNSQGP